MSDGVRRREDGKLFSEFAGQESVGDVSKSCLLEGWGRGQTGVGERRTTNSVKKLSCWRARG